MAILKANLVGNRFTNAPILVFWLLADLGVYNWHQQLRTSGISIPSLEVRPKRRDDHGSERQVTKRSVARQSAPDNWKLEALLLDSGFLRVN